MLRRYLVSVYYQLKHQPRIAGVFEYEHMASRVENVNPNILRQCREQAGLDLSDVETKISKIREIEDGEHSPTFLQLDTLATLYSVPRWVFIADEIPSHYRFDQAIPAFRQFSRGDAGAFLNAKVRRVVAKVERYRDLMLDLTEDLDDVGISRFEPPIVSDSENPEGAAHKIREWISPGRVRHDFEEWRGLLEQRGVFVFLTSKYRGWSNIDELNLRGLSMFHELLPVIIVNDSDAKKARSFTLLHELGHIVRRENALDSWDAEFDRGTEIWCDEFAGNILMPEPDISRAVAGIIDLDLVKRVARSFKVSSYAFLVRLRQLNIVDHTEFLEIRDEIFEEYAQQRQRLRESDGGPARNRPKEVLTQYGRTFTNLVFQAYNDREIGLQKTSSLLGLKRPSQALEVQALL